MKAVKKFSVFVLAVSLILIIVCLLSSCGSSDKEYTKYNEEIIASENYNFRKDFIKDNYTYGAMYDSVNEIDIEENDQLPETRTIIVKTDSSLQEIFNNFPEIDFESEMIILYGCTAVAQNEDKIVSIELKEFKLKITYGYQITDEPHVPDASLPRTKWVVIRMNQVEFEEIEMIYLGGVK